MNKKNSGFSLVELIVVIAIMAVLVGVLAPAYLKYVEKSRKSADIDAISEMMGAAEKVAVAPEFEDYIAAGAKFTITVNKTMTLSFVNGGTDTTKDADVTKEWKSDANAASGYSIKSKDFKTENGTAVGTILSDGTGSIAWKATSIGKLLKYSSAFSGKFSA